MQYNVLRATEWKGHQDTHGNQIWYIEIEGYEGKNIRTNKKPGNTPATGSVEGELSIEGDKGYFRYSPPNGFQSGAAVPRSPRPISGESPARQKSIERQSALVQAVAYVTGEPERSKAASEPEDVIAVAKKFLSFIDPEEEPRESDVVITEEPDSVLEKARFFEQLPFKFLRRREDAKNK